MKRTWGYAVAACVLAALAGTLWLQRARTVEARRLRGAELLGNLQGYLKVERIEEAAQVLEALRAEDESRDYLDQARYEVARAYVAAGKGELAIALLDQITLHDRSFDFQRAVLREKLRGLHSFFFDPSGDLRAPAQLEDFVFHSRHNPDESQRTKDPKGFEDPNKLLDYFNAVARQLEDVLAIQGAKRTAEPALAEGYDTIQILLYGRGLISHDELLKRLATSTTGASPRTLYLLGNQYFVEADYERAFDAWGRLAKSAPADKTLLRAFVKTHELFEGRRLLGKAFAFWPLARPAWLDALITQEPFKAAAAEATRKLAEHQDVAKYGEVTHGTIAPTDPAKPAEDKEVVVAPDILGKAELGDHFEVIAPETPDLHSVAAEPLVLARAHHLGWRLQTEFREFMLVRGDRSVFTPRQKKPLMVRSSYHGELRFEARRFADGDTYRRYQTLSAADAVQAAAALPVAKTWTDDSGPLVNNGTNAEHGFTAPLDKPGFYLITARARYAPVVAAVQMAVVAEKVLTWASPSSVLFRTVERESGQPIAGARLHGTIEPRYDLGKIAPQFHDGSRSQSFRDGLSLGFTAGKRDELTTNNDEFLAGFAEGLKLREKFPIQPEKFEVKTDADGVAALAVPQKWSGVTCAVAAALNNLGAVCPIQAVCAQPGESKKWQALFYAERPIFQPGEKARIKGILRMLGNAGLSLPPGEEVECMLWHGGALYGVFRATPNQAGTITIEAPLSESAPLGGYDVTIGHDGTRYPVFRVDRGDRPLLNVAVKPDADIVFAGSTVRGRVQALRLGNIAAVGVPVAIKVYRGEAPAAPKPNDPREDFFEPVKLQEYPNSDHGDTLRERLRTMKEVWTAQGTTDAKGEFAFSFDSDKREAARYLVLADVKPLPHRREIATAEILSYDLPVFLDVKTERAFYYPGETLRGEVLARALDGKAVAAALRLEIAAEGGAAGSREPRVETLKTDKDGRARFAVPLGKGQVSVRVGVQGTAGWAYRDVAYTLRQIGASSGDKGLTLQLDRKAYYPGEKAHITIQSDRPGADVLVTVSREKVRRHQRFVIQGTTGTLDVPLADADAPNIFFHAVTVGDDAVRSASVELPVIPAQKFLKVEIETDKEAYAGGATVAALVRVRDWQNTPVADTEVSLSAVLSSAFVLQEDLTPDLTRYFHNHRLPLWVTLGGSELAQDHPRGDSFWTAAVFAWGIYNDLAGIGVDTGFGHGSFGSGHGGGRRLMVKRHGGSRATAERIDAYADFLRQHGLTLFYEARLVTDNEGKAKVEFLLPASSGEFRFTARALTADTLVGEIRRAVTFRQDVCLQTPWPVSIREGERFQTPLFVVNNSAQEQKGTLSVSADLSATIVAERPEISVPPGGVVRVDIELDARTLPAALADAKTGYHAPLTFAKVAATFAPEAGPKIANEAMIPVYRRGIAVEKRAVALARASQPPKEVRFDLAQALPGSVRLELKPLGDPKQVARWLLEELKQREGGHCYAWAAETMAERLAPADVAAGKFLPVEAPLLAGLSRGPWGDRGIYLRLVTSAVTRGVRLPSEWGARASDSAAGAIENCTPLEAWALAEYLAGKENKAEAQVKLAARLDALRAATAGREEWAYLALALHKLERRSNAALCLNQAISDIQFRRRENARELPLSVSAALLLASVTVGADAETAGALYAAVLDSLAHTPRPEPWAAALAVQAVMAWGTQWQTPAEPLTVRINGKETKLEARGVENFPAAGGVVTIAVPPPAKGAVAAEIVCAWRLADDCQPHTDGVTLARRMARVAADGTGEWLQPGEAVRLGETLLMLLDVAAPGSAHVVVPSAGPWEAAPQHQHREPSVRVRREFALSPIRVERVLAAAEEKRLPDARAEMLAAIAAGDYLEDVEGGNEVQTAAPVIMPAESQMAHTQYRIREDPRIVLAFRPDRTGQFVAPAAWVTHATDGSPLSVAAPFAFQVLEADAALPSRPSELRVREELRARVTAALQLAPDSYLSARLSQTTTSLDLRDLAFVGLFNTQDAKAADAYAALCAAAGTAASLDALREAQEWRERLTLSADATPTPLLLKRALESDDLAGALARALDALELPTERPAAERAETISTALSEVLLILAYEDTWRRQTCAALRRNPALEYVRPRMLWRGDVLRRMKPAAADAMLNTLDELANVPRRATRGPTLHEALKSWAEYEGLSLAIADGVPNLEAEEFTLALPEVPSVRDLDESLRGLYLRARRKGLEVSVYADVIEPALRPEARELLAAKDAEGRLRAFLNAHKTDGNGLLTLAAKRESAESGYTPRVEAPGELPASEFLPKLALSAEHSIWEQRAALRAQGLRLETADGVLRLVLVK